MGSLVHLHHHRNTVDAVDPGGATEVVRAADRPPALRASWPLAAVAAFAPVVVALLLTPWRDRLAAADDALLLVVVIVAVATAGRRWAAALCAVSAALSFDFFLTRPYLSLRITRSSDLTTELLLLVVGLLVGDLAARGRHHRTTAREGRGHLAALHAVTELAAAGGEPEDVARLVVDELRHLLTLRSCTYATGDGGLAARLLPDGEVRVGAVVWNTVDLGLPHRGVDLPVRSGGEVVGHFLLVPEPGVNVGRDLLLVAVSLADQVGASVAAAPGPVATHR
jgi:K+-sensing histidine kinase KdpD